MYYINGYNGQDILIFPEHELVIVRLGLTHVVGLWDKETFALKVLESLK